MSLVGQCAQLVSRIVLHFWSSPPRASPALEVRIRYFHVERLDAFS